MKGVTYFKWWGFSINEGKGPFNIHISWFKHDYRFYVYIYFKGKRWFKIWKGGGSGDDDPGHYQRNIHSDKNKYQ